MQKSNILCITLYTFKEKHPFNTDGRTRYIFRSRAIFGFFRAYFVISSHILKTLRCQKCSKSMQKSNILCITLYALKEKHPFNTDGRTRCIFPFGRPRPASSGKAQQKACPEICIDAGKYAQNSYIVSGYPTEVSSTTGKV